MNKKRDSDKSKTGILLLNLGSPDAPTAEALKAFLAEFLSDRYVVDYPRWLWMPVLNRIILKKRPARSAALYQTIWTEQGSPLIVLTESLAKKLQSRLNQLHQTHFFVAAGMRYGSPSIQSRINELIDKGIGHLIILPLFPQYSTTTTQTGLDEVEKALKQLHFEGEVQVINNYHDHPAYISALAESIRQSWEGLQPPEKLLFSFHGVPKRYCKFDPYVEQCVHTAELLAESLGLRKGQWAYAFQSRFGPETWAQPYTGQLLTEWGNAGVSSVSVTAPGFAIDCLETLDELGREAKEIFLAAGGETFNYIPALNDTTTQENLLAAVLAEKFGES